MSTLPDATPSVATPPRRSRGGWAPRRPYTVDADGRVRYLDGPPAEASPVAATEPETVEAAAAVALPEASAPPPVEPEEAPPPVAARAAEAPVVPSPPRSRLPGPRQRRPRPALSELPDAEIAPVQEPEATPAPEPVVTPLADEADDAEVGEPATDEEAPRRRRRSRRGGRGRRRNGATPDGELTGESEVDDAIEVAVEDDRVIESVDLEPEPLAAPPRRGERSSVSSLESLVARQNVILEQLMQRQERMARSMEAALKAAEARITGTDLSRVSAMPRLAVFVDVPNIILAADRYRVAVDFGRLLDYVGHDRTLIRASAYAPISDDPTQRLEDQRFVEPFLRHGYRIVTKPLKRFSDGSIKANFDVELAMDILTMSDRLDIVSLVSGDGDFRRLVDLVASKGVRVEVVSFGQSTSADLKAVADTYIDLTQHLRDLCVPIEGEIRERRPRPKVDISGYTAGG